MGKPRNDNGTYASEHDADKSDVLDAIADGEPYTTGLIADLVGAPRRTVYNWLQALAEDGKVRKLKPNERTAIWMVDDE